MADWIESWKVAEKRDINQNGILQSVLWFGELNPQEYALIPVSKNSSLEIIAKKGPQGWNDGHDNIFFGPEGHPNGRTAPNVALPGAPKGSLVASFSEYGVDKVDLTTWSYLFHGGNSAFGVNSTASYRRFIGATRTRFTPPMTGFMYLWFNDDWRGYGNNVGTISITVTEFP